MQRTEPLLNPQSLGPQQRTEELDASPTAAGTLRLQDFVVGEKLGEGGSASVHAAVHTPTGRKVALKTIRREYGDDPKFVGRFEREVRAAQSLSHDNVCQVLGWGSEGGQLFLAMEYLEGASLALVLHRVGALPAQVAAVLLDQLLDAVGAAHKAGVLHRDIKPANLLITDAGQLKLLDFGIAKRKDDIKVTETGHLVGTPAYMSPEHAAGEELDARSDLYSCGVVLYEMLVGSNPFEKLGTSTTLLRIVNEGITPIFAHAVTAPGTLEALFERLCERSRDRRFADADSARALLAPYVAFATRARSDLVPWFFRDVRAHKVELDREVAVIEQLRADDLEGQGAASLPAATIALWRAVHLEPDNKALQARFEALCQRTGAHFDTPTDKRVKAAMDDAEAFGAAGAFKHAAEVCRGAGYLVPAVVFLRRYLRERPNDTVAAQQLQVLVAGTQPERTAAANQRSGLRTVDIIAGVKTAGAIVPASANPSTQANSAYVNREQGRAVEQRELQQQTRARVAEATASTQVIRARGATATDADASNVGRLFFYGAALVGVLFMVVWGLKTLVFVEVVATQRMVSDNVQQVGIAENANIERRRDNLLLDLRSQVAGRSYEVALGTAATLLKDAGLPGAIKSEALYLRGMAYIGVGDRQSARRAMLDYQATAPSTDKVYVQVKELIDGRLSSDDAFRRDR